MDKNKHELLELQPLKYCEITEEYTEHRTVSGFILPGNSRLMVMSNVSGEVFGMWRQQLQANVFNVQGTTTFKADLNTFKVIKGYTKSG